MTKIKVIKIEPVRWNYDYNKPWIKPHPLLSLTPGKITETEIEDTPEALREAVGGHFDMHYVSPFVYHEKWFNDIPGHGDLVFVVNRIGKLDGLAPCMLFGGEVFCGTVIIYNAAGFEGAGKSLAVYQTSSLIKHCKQAQKDLLKILTSGGIR